ncbi:MAG: DUF424 family protein [Candidatus Diapherotrites archaeon]
MHKAQGLTVFACCEKELLGKTLEDEKFRVKISESFFGGKEMGEEKVRRMLHEADSANLFGETPVRIALEKKIAGERDVIKIKGVPHLQIYRLR